MTNQDIRGEILVLAGEALSYFEHRMRHDGTKYWAVEEDAPEWVHKLAFAAHSDGKIIPEDFRYLFIVEALEALVENPEEPEVLWKPDAYTSELLKWLDAYPSYRINLVDKAVIHFGWSGLFNALQDGQLMEKDEVLQLVLEFLKKRIEDGEED